MSKMAFTRALSLPATVHNIFRKFLKQQVEHRLSQGLLYVDALIVCARLGGGGGAINN